MGTKRDPKPIAVNADAEPVGCAPTGYRIRLLASRAGFARPDAEIGFIELAGDTVRTVAGSTVVDDVFVAYATEVLSRQRKLSAPWVTLRELLATPVEDLEISKADITRLQKKHIARLGEALLAKSPVPEPVVEEAREAASKLLGELKRELEKILEETADAEVDADTDKMWRPGDDLVAQREAILGHGGKAPYSAEEVMRVVSVTTRQALAEQRKKGQLFALPVGQRNFLYPRWQFAGASGKLVPGLAAILADDATHQDPWGVADVLTSPQKVFNGKTPIEMLAKGAELWPMKKTIELVRRAYS